MAEFFRRPFLWQFLLLLLGWCLVVELIIRTFLVSPSQTPNDAVLGWRWPSNSTFLVQTADAGYREVSVNALGYNDDPVDPRDPRTRFVVLGDSFVEAFQVSRDKNFMHLIQRDMPRFRLINAGQSGLNPASELAVLNRFEARLRLDGVVLLLNNGDQADLLQTNIKVKDCRALIGICDYRLPSQSEGTLKSFLRPIMARSALATFLLHKYKNLSDGAFADVRRSDHGSIAKHKAGDWRAYEPTDTADFLELVFERIHKKHPLIVVFVPTLQFTLRGKAVVVGSRSFPTEAETAARKAGVRFLNISEVLSAAYAQSGQPPTGFDFSEIGAGHLNELGHQALARALEIELTKLKTRAGS